MSDLMKDLNDKINEVLKTKRNMESMIYKDEPIIRKASQMSNYVPPVYKELETLAEQHGRNYAPREYIFYQQAVLAKDLVDDYPYKCLFYGHHATYQSFRPAVLRGYFSWRSQIRSLPNYLDWPDTSSSYVYLHIFEVLHLIGYENATAAFFHLCDVWMRYRNEDNMLDQSMILWIKDFVVYYDLDWQLLSTIPEPFADLAEIPVFDQQLMVIQHPEEYTEEERFAAICGLSTYNLEKSRLLKEHRSLVQAVTLQVFDTLTEYFDKNRRTSLIERYWGRITRLPVYLFSGAVFWDYRVPADHTYAVHPNLKYHCKNGYWSCERFFGTRGKNKELGQILKLIDARLRASLDSGHTLKEPDLPKYLTTMIDKAVSEALARKKKAEEAKKVPPPIHIDLSRLDAIRADAAITRDKLIVDEALEPVSDTTVAEMLAPTQDTLPDEPSTAPESQSVVEPMVSDTTAATPADPTNDWNLTEEETTILHALLYRGDAQRFIAGYAKSKNLMLSILLDTINDKLFDTFGDTVILYEGDAPELIEDYIDELKEGIPE